MSETSDHWSTEKVSERYKTHSEAITAIIGQHKALRSRDSQLRAAHARIALLQSELDVQLIRMREQEKQIEGFRLRVERMIREEARLTGRCNPSVPLGEVMPGCADLGELP